MNELAAFGAFTESAALSSTVLTGAAAEENTFRWATVIDDAPFTIQLDGDTLPLNLVPDTLIAPPAAGRRVWVQLFRRRVIVLGVSGG